MSVVHSPLQNQADRTQAPRRDSLPSIEAYLVVRQTFSAIHIRLITQDSASVSLANNIPRDEDSVYAVASVYRNTPLIGHRDHSPIHYEAMLLRVEGDPAMSLGGQYWTDRLTRGEVQFTHRSKTLYFDFASASDGTFIPA